MREDRKDASLYLKMLKEDGVEEIYLPPAGKTHGASASQTQAATGSLASLQAQALACVRCGELAAKRKNVVFGSGSPSAALMFVGEAPGQEEDEQGLPFVGAAGQLLTKIIESIGVKREDVYIANVLKCRPPGNRPPKPDEISSCNPYLRGQIEVIRPRVLCALGTFAAQTLLQTETPISRLRGKFSDYQGIKLMCTFHPAYLLRNPGEKRKVWEDMKMIKNELDSSHG